MESYSITKLDLSINTENLEGKSLEEIKKYVDDSICPVVLIHLTTKPKGGEVHGDIRCTADRDRIRCEGSIGGSIKF